MISKKGKVALGGLGGCALGAGYMHRKMSTAIERFPFIHDGLSVAKLETAPLGYFKFIQFDDLNNVANASLTAEGKKIYIAANRVVTAVPSKVTEDEVYEDLEAEGSGIAFYWENPWEVKALLIRGFKFAYRKVRSYIAAVSPDNDDEDETGKPGVKWEVTSVIVDDEEVLGSRLMHPAFSSIFFEKQNGLKSEKSRQRAIYVLSGLGLWAALLALSRGIVNYRMWPSFVFARNYIQNHTAVKQFYDDKGIEVIARTGIFSSTKIESEITVAGKMNSIESVVKFSASRPNKTAQWMVSQASMTPKGCKPIDLLVA